MLQWNRDFVTAPLVSLDKNKDIINSNRQNQERLDLQNDKRSRNAVEGEEPNRTKDHTHLNLLAHSILPGNT